MRYLKYTGAVVVRPIIFGYPINEASVLEVRGYQGMAGEDFILSRIDLDRPDGCTRAEADLGFLAIKCHR